ncbi:hypothetical protein NXZ75_08745 [Lysinibacillus sphaericus]|uniref:hypothetical protein n=1 Tax=Lysinibacillus sphaericus TaxID=1421 RepID=UPI002163D7AE|nr:hypothetical protein [Lysinibacillus sphaericus]MCS1382283.1 hypothetical protein [Lysinibacillus sphaericus]
MKKFLVVAMASMLVLGVGMANKKVEASRGGESVDRITWEYAGELKAQKGFDKNIGTAGVLAGSYKDYLIVGGGANFPYDTVLNGGAKKHYSDVYVYKKDNNKLTLVEHTNLNHEFVMERLSRQKRESIILVAVLTKNMQMISHY